MRMFWEWIHVTLFSGRLIWALFFFFSDVHFILGFWAIGSVSACSTSYVPYGMFVTHLLCHLSMFSCSKNLPLLPVQWSKYSLRNVTAKYLSF
jgi:hypothetical protein